MAGNNNESKNGSENASSYNPFPGPRPFNPDEGKYFFGREREKLELTARILANRVVFLYAKSGAGKTSLLNASLLPSLGTEEDFDVLPVVRLGKPLPKDIDPAEVKNIFVFNALRALTNDADPKSLVSQRLTGFLFEDFVRKTMRLSANENRPAPRVLVFDQLEEIFTTYPERWKDRKSFFVQLSAALDPDPEEWKERLESAGLAKDAIEPDRSLRVLFALREDHLANLHSYADLLPVKPSIRVRIEQLRAAAACEAMECPAQLTGRPFEKGVACELVGKLLERRVKVAGAGVETVEGEFVEPVQLQIICKKLFQILPSNKPTIDSNDLSMLGDVNEPLAEYYNAAIAQAVEQTGEKESTLRDWFEHSLITPAGTRGTAFMDPDSVNTAGVQHKAVSLFEDLYLVRGENRPGGVWYELTHDRFIEPVLQSNKRWRNQFADENRQRLETQAKNWSQQKTGLMDEAELKGAENWLTTPQAATLGYSQTLLAYIKTSRAEVYRKQFEDKNRSALRLRQFAAALAVLFFIALVAAGVAQYQTSKANAANEQLLAQASELEKQRKVAVDGKAEADVARGKAQEAEAVAIAQTAEAVKAKEEVEEANERLKKANKRAEDKADEARESARAERNARNELVILTEQLKLALGTADDNFLTAQRRADELAVAKRKLEDEGKELARQKRLAEAQALAAASRAADEDPFNSVQLAVNAIDKTSEDELVVKEAIDSLNAVLPGVLLEKPPIKDFKRVVSASFSENDGPFITVTADGTIRRWTFSAREWVSRDYDLGEHIGTSALTPDGKILAVSTSGEPKDPSDNSARPNTQDGLLRNIRLMNLEREQESTIFGHRRGVLRLGLDSGGNYLATSNTFGNYAVVNIDINGKSKGAWNKPNFFEKLRVRIFHKPFRLVNTFAFSHTNEADKNDPMLLATGFQNGEVVVRDTRNGELCAKIPVSGQNGHTDTILAMAFHPRRKSLVTSSRDNTLKVWSLSPDALKANKKIAAFVSDLSIVNEWGAADQNVTYHDNPVTSIAFDKEGKLMATGSEDGTVWIWRVEPVSGSYKPLVRLPDHTAQVTSVTFSVDGKRLASIAADNKARIWDLSFFDDYLKLKDEVERLSRETKLSPGYSISTKDSGIDDLKKKLKEFSDRYGKNHPQ